MIVDENSRDHFGRPRDVTTTSAMAASVNPPITRSLWPSRAGSDHPSLDVASSMLPTRVSHRRVR